MAVKKFVSLNVQLKQKVLSFFCDKGIFKIVLDVFLNKLDELKDLLPVLGGFHMAKAALHTIGRYVKRSRLDDILKQTKVYGPKTLESVIAGTHYVQSLRLFQI